MEGQRVAKKEGGGKLPWILTGIGVALAGAYLGLCAWAGSRQEILPNVSVAGIDVSNLAVEQARDKVETALSQMGGDVTLTLSYEDVQESMNGADVAVDVEESVRAAQQVGHENFLTGGFQLAGHMLGMSSQLPLILPEDEPAQAALVERMEQAVSAATEDHGYQVEGDRLVMTKGAPIPTVDWEDARTRMAENLQAMYARVFSGHSEKENAAIALSASRNEQQDPDFEAIHREVCTQPKDAALDLESMTITDHTVGVDFDVEALKSAYHSAGGGETFSIPLTLTQPKVTKDDLGGSLFRDVLGEATTTVTGNAARKSNVKIAAARCNDVILLPGEEFSYNNTAGPFSASVGYLPAPVYVAGRSEDGVGGGVCQPSSTIYYAVLHTTLEVVERRNHQFAVSYMPAGMDATVTGSSIDFRFKNNTDYPIKIVTSSYDSGGARKLNVKIYGTNIDGRYAVPSSSVFDVVTPTTTYQPDAGVPRGTLVLEREQNPYTGKKARTYRTICEADGTVVEKQDMGLSSYKMRTRIYYYNPADGDPATWVDGKPPVNPGTTAPANPGTTAPANPGTTVPVDPGATAPVDPGSTAPIDPGATAPVDPGTATPADPGAAAPGDSETEAPPSDSGLNPIDPNAAAA